MYMKNTIRTDHQDIHKDLNHKSTYPYDVHLIESP